MADSYTQVLENLLVAQMAIRNEFDQSTINFFRAIYPNLVRMKEMNTNQMADAVGYTQQAASEHRDKLEKRGYLVRINYRTWKLNIDALTHPLLTIVLDLNVQVYKEGNKYYATRIKSKESENVSMPQTA